MLLISPLGCAYFYPVRSEIYLTRKLGFLCQTLGLPEVAFQKNFQASIRLKQSHWSKKKLQMQNDEYKAQEGIYQKKR